MKYCLNKKKKKEILSVKHLAGSPTCITGAETAAISQAVAISMATLCDGYRQPHFTDEMLREVKGLAQGDTAPTGRTGIQSHVHPTPKPSWISQCLFFFFF